MYAPVAVTVGEARTVGRPDAEVGGAAVAHDTAVHRHGVAVVDTAVDATAVKQARYAVNFGL